MCDRKKWNPGAFVARLGIVVLLVCAAMAVAAQPADFSADYRVTRKMLGYEVTLASASLSLEHEADGAYRYVSVLKPVQLVALAYGDTLTETSRGRIASAPAGDGRAGGSPVEAGTVLPERYEMTLEGRKPRSGSLQFESGRGVIVQRFKNKEVRQRVPAETFDRLSIQLALMRDLAAGRRDMKYLMADQNRLRVYRFEATAEERLKTPVGDVLTVKVELTGRLRVDNGAGLKLATAETVDDFDDGERTSFWFAPTLGYLPVRIQHVDDDLGVFRMDIERVEFPRRQQLSGGS